MGVKGTSLKSKEKGETCAESSIVQLAETGQNGDSSTPEPHKTHRYAPRGGCVEGETASTEAGSKDKGFVVMRRGGGIDMKHGEEDETNEDEERWGKDE